jgi:hypothetical protein
MAYNAETLEKQQRRGRQKRALGRLVMIRVWDFFVGLFTGPSQRASWSLG